MLMLLYSNIRIVAMEQAVATLRQHPLGIDQDVRVSLRGLQSKLLLVQVDGGWARPVGGTLSTHILKPDPPEFRGLAASEAFAQRVAALAGLDAAEVRLRPSGIGGFLSRRGQVMVPFRPSTLRERWSRGAGVLVRV
jgi:hypothetical protein